MDLETFMTELYVLVDDWYKEAIAEKMQRHAGGSMHMSDSEVLTIALAGQWRVGVPWASERGVVRWMQIHGRGMFPQMLCRSAFNERVRNLWGAFILLHQVVAQALSSTSELYECVDSVPLPAFSPAQGLRESGHWLWESCTGHGGTRGGFYMGDQVLVCVTPSGVISGWLLANANIDERWLLSLFLSQRCGQAHLSAPQRSSKQVRSRAPSQPLGHIGPLTAVGQAHNRPYLADRGFNSYRWQRHWFEHYGACVLSVPPLNDPTHAAWSSKDCLFLAAHRQMVETTFASLVEVFGWLKLQAHSRWGQYTRVAAKFAAYHLGLFLNRALGRPLHALATLIA